MLGFPEDVPQDLVPGTSAVIYANHASNKRFEKEAGLSHLCTKVRGVGMYRPLYTQVGTFSVCSGPNWPGFSG